MCTSRRASRWRLVPVAARLASGSHPRAQICAAPAPWHVPGLAHQVCPYARPSPAPPCVRTVSSEPGASKYVSYRLYVGSCVAVTWTHCQHAALTAQPPWLVLHALCRRQHRKSAPRSAHPRPTTEGHCYVVVAQQRLENRLSGHYCGRLAREQPQTRLNLDRSLVVAVAMK